MKNKKASGRSKDLVDFEKLQQKKNKKAIVSTSTYRGDSDKKEHIWLTCLPHNLIMTECEKFLLNYAAIPAYCTSFYSTEYRIICRLHILIFVCDSKEFTF